MDDLIKQKLSSLLDLLNNPALKSRQAAFDACFNELTQVRELASWEAVVDVIQKETGIEIDWRIASNMYGRTRKKLGNVSKRPVLKTNEQAAGNATQTDNTGDEKKRVDNPADLLKIRNRKIDLDDLKNGD